MPRPPDYGEMFDRAVDEGERRLEQSTVQLVATAFIAGFTIVFGIVALGIAHAAVEPQLGEIARIAGALAFGVGLVFLVVGRAELFSENFYDPSAAVVAERDVSRLWELGRLWAFTFAFNLVGGLLFVLVLSVEGALPPGTGEALATTAEEIAHRTLRARFASAFAGGALVSLLSFLLVAVDSDGGRIFLAYATGVLLALAPFDHVVVTVLHVVAGMTHGAPIALETVAELLVVDTVGNLVGGIGLVTTTHVVQALGGGESSD